MCFIVACRAQTDEISIYICKLRVFIGVFDVMHYCSWRVLPVPFAPLANVSITAQDAGFFPLPFCAVVIKLHYGFAFPADAWPICAGQIVLFPASLSPRQNKSTHPERMDAFEEKRRVFMNSLYSLSLGYTIAYLYTEILCNDFNSIESSFMQEIYIAICIF